MERKKIKKNRKKVLCYQKGTSNSSVSELLNIGAYKRQIKKLLRNNRSLAVELQCYRQEVSRLEKLLKKWTNFIQQVGHARLKFKEMASTFAKQASDMIFVSSLLEGEDFAGENEQGPHEKLKMRVPSISCIEEESQVISPGKMSADDGVAKECEVTAHPEVIQTPEHPSVNDLFGCENTPCLPPILFVDEPEGKRAEKITSNQLSLTPELDLDLNILKKRRTSSRRMTQYFVFPDKRMTRSSAKATSSGSCTESAPSVTSEGVSSPRMPELCEERNSSEYVRAVGRRLVNDFPDKNDCISSIVANDETPQQVQNMEAMDHTNLFPADMELTEVINTVTTVHVPFPATVGSSSSAMKSSEEKSEIADSEKEPDSASYVIEAEEDDNVFPEADNMISSDVESNGLETAESGAFEKDCRDPNDPKLKEPLCKTPEHCSCDPTPVFPLEQDKDKSPPKIKNFLDDTFSPFPIKLPSPRKYAKVFFSSSDESDSSPKQKSSGGRNSLKCSKPVSKSKISSVDLNFKEDAIKEERKRGVSIYDLEVSNSEMTKSQKAKLNRNKKKALKDASKNLERSLKLPKDKSVKYKSSKTEVSDKQNKVNYLLEHKPVLDKPVLEVHSATASLDESLSDDNQDCPKLVNVTVLPIKNPRRSILSSTKRFEDNFSSRPLTPKRVCFAVTDTVCRFSKASSSKIISEKEKEKRASKFISNEDVEGVAADITVNEKMAAVEFLNSSDETELYNIPIDVCALSISNPEVEALPLNPCLVVTQAAHMPCAIASVTEKTQKMGPNAKDISSSKASAKVSGDEKVKCVSKSGKMSEDEKMKCVSKSGKMSEDEKMKCVSKSGKMSEDEKVKCISNSGKMSEDKKVKCVSKTNEREYSHLPTNAEVANGNAASEVLRKTEHVSFDSFDEILASIKKAGPSSHNSVNSTKSGKMSTDKKVISISKTNAMEYSCMPTNAGISNGKTVSKVLQGTEPLSSDSFEDILAVISNVERSSAAKKLKHSKTIRKTPKMTPLNMKSSQKLSLKVNKRSLNCCSDSADDDRSESTVAAQLIDGGFAASPCDSSREKEKFKTNQLTVQRSPRALLGRSKRRVLEDDLKENENGKINQLPIRRGPRALLSTSKGSSLQLSPALKDVNSEEDRVLPKRRSRANMVNYKEPSLTKKMRRT